MTKFILDTNAVISLIENKNKNFLRNFMKASFETNGEISITILNYYEYLRGTDAVTNVEYRKILEKYLKETISVIQYISLDDAKKASKIYQETRGNKLSKQKKRKEPSDVDILMATIALNKGATIVSHDDDFRRIKGLKTENWES